MGICIFILNLLILAVIFAVLIFALFGAIYLLCLRIERCKRRPRRRSRFRFLCQSIRLYLDAQYAIHAALKRAVKATSQHKDPY